MMRAIQVLDRMVLHGREAAKFTASDYTDRQLRALMGNSLPTCAVNVGGGFSIAATTPAAADRACPP